MLNLNSRWSSVMFHLFTLRDLEDIPGVAMEVLEVPLSSMEVVEEVRPSLHWTRRSTLSTSSSITAGCSSRPSSTLSTPCSSSSTTGLHLVLRAQAATPPARDIYPGFSLVELLHYCPLIGGELQSIEIFS